MKPSKLVALLVSLLSLASFAFSQNRCNCYYSNDCNKGRNPVCQVGGNCLPMGKLDGECSFIAAPPPDLSTLTSKDLELISADKLAMSAALDAYFESYMKAIENGGGQPDAKSLQKALDVRLTQKERQNVEMAVWVSLDTMMGWDFMYPTQTQRAAGYFGNIREVGGVGSASGIVNAAKLALLDALNNGNTAGIEAPLLDFWAKNPNYMPRHMGRCYPHGHSELHDMKGAVECQVQNLHSLGGILLETAASAATSKVENKTAAKK